MDRKSGLILIALIGALSAAACGSFGPPPSCGETIGIRVIVDNTLVKNFPFEVK
ncbi:MAG: hypothetical protein ABIJ39_05760 [Chloroflexota bacterium]